MLREVVVGGGIGRPLSLRAEAGQHLPTWRPGADYRVTVSARAELGGGAVLELSHELDYARWILGEAAAVSARAGRLSDLDIDVEDVAEIVVEFRSGALGSVHLDMVRQPAGRACRIIGTGGTVEWDVGEPSVRLFRSETYVEELRHFLRCVRTGEQPMVTGEDGRQALALALAAKESARLGRVIAL
jgi:predicted dehydrogenase